MVAPNALDAGSSHVKVDLGAERVVIEDDGRGFKNKEELVKFFERFGFDHSNLDRKVGRFGVLRWLASPEAQAIKLP